MGRIITGILLEAVLAVVLALLLAGSYQSLLGSPPAVAFFTEAPRLILVFMDIGIVVWVALLVVGAVRKRGLGWGVWGSVLAALIGAAVNLFWVFILSVLGGGADVFAIALGVEAGILFVIAVAIVAPLVRRVILKGAAPR